MLNTTPLNTSELNSPGASAESVLLGATGAVAVAGTPPELVFSVGMAGTGAAVVTQSAVATRGRTAQASAAVAVTHFADVEQTKSLAASSAVAVSGVLGLSIPHELAASASVDAVGVAYTGSELYASAAVDVTSTADAANIEALAGTGAVTAVGAESGYIDNQLSAVAAVAVAGIADPDAEVGGVLYVGLGGRPSVDVTSDVEIDPTERITALSPVQVSSAAALTITFRLPATGTVAAVGTPPELHVYTGGMAGSIPVAVTGTVAALRTANMAAAAVVAVAATPRLGSVRRLDAVSPVVATSSATPVLRAGLRTNAPVVVTSSATTPRITEKLYATGAVAATSIAAPIYYVRKNFGANALVSVTHSATPVYFTRRNLEVAATITVAGELAPRSLFGLATVAPVVALGTATLRTNLFSLEPDYRTLPVERQEFALLVEPQEFTLIVTTDAVPMQTFTKQPTEILPYDIDFTDWIAGITGGDEVESATCTVTAATSGATSALVIDSVLLIADTARVKVWVSAGTNGVTYKLTLVMLTAAGRRKEVDFRIKIKET